MEGKNLEKKKQLGYSSQFALVISLIAGCVGTGNIWRFPRVAATNGGGTFIVAWTIMWALVCIPIMLGEHVIGRATRHGTPGAFRDFIGKKFAWMGVVVAITMAGVAAYYSTIIAWVLQYLGLSISKGYYGVEDKQALFDSISNGNIVTVILFVLVLALSAFIVLKGIKGIEKANKFFIPILFICLMISAFNSLRLPGASEGLHYLFNIDFHDLLSYKVWLEALTQAVWSAGPGWGLVITLAVFSRAKSDVGLTTITQGFGDNAGALLAALVVLPAIFAVAPTIAAAEEICHGGNNGLTFVSMTAIFENMPGGYLVSILFFTSLFVAAISSNVCHFMICSLPFVDSGMKKEKAVKLMFIILLIWGLPSAWNINFLSNQDWVFGQLMVVGSMFSCFAIIKFGTKKIREQFINNKYKGIHIGFWWEICIKIIAPIIVVTMFLWWSIQSIGWEANWWNPFGVFSLGTFIVQGGLIILISILFNKKVSNSIKDKYFDGESFPPIPDNGFSG